MIWLGGAVVTYNLLPNGWRKRPATVALYCVPWPFWAVVFGGALLVEWVER